MKVEYCRYFICNLSTSVFVGQDYSLIFLYAIVPSNKWPKSALSHFIGW